MKTRFLFLAAICAFAPAAPALADASDGARVRPDRNSAELPAYLQCVPYAREVSGIQIYGDAHTWWDKAEGRYRRGTTPRVGAVMAFAPHRSMQLGHVAAVSKVIDSRHVLLDHANWSPINGRRGQIERNVMAMDVSPDNDWSMVRVWYDPAKALGTTPWPVRGFIYSDKPQTRRPQIASARQNARPAPPAPQPVVRQKDSPEFAQAFASLGEPARASARPALSVRRAAQASRSVPSARATRAVTRQVAPAADPLDAVVRRYDR